MNASIEPNNALILQHTVEAISSMLELPASIWIVDETKNVLRAVAVTKTVEKIREAELSLDGPSVAAETFKTLKTSIIPDVGSHKSWQLKAESRSAGVESGVISPLLVKNMKVGVLVVYVPKDNDVNLEEVKLKAEVSASQIAATLRHIQGLETLNEVGHLINAQIQNPRLLLENIMKSAQQVLSCEHVSIFMKEDTSGDLVLRESSSDKLSRNRFKPGEGLAGEVVQTGKSMCVLDATNHPKYLPGLHFNAESRSMLLSPIKSEGGDVIGVISADIDVLDGFDSQDLLWLETLTNQAALAIKNTQVYYHVNQRRRALVDIAKKLTEKIYLQEPQVYELIYEQATQKLNVDNFFIALYDEKNEMVRFAIACSEGRLVPVDTDDGWKHRKWNADHKIETIISTNEPLLLNSRKEIERRFTARPEKKMASSWLGVPMYLGEKTLGVIATYHYEQEYFFNDDDVDIFQALADLASIAIENIRLYTQRNQDIRALQEINEAVVSKNRNEILQLIVKKAVETIPGEYSSLWLIEYETGDLVLEAVYRPSEAKAKEIKRLNKAGETSINAIVANTGNPYICPDVEFEPRFYAIYEEAKSSVTVPLRYQSVIIGTLNVESSRRNAFNEYHINFLDSLSDQAAIAIENFRLYNQLQDQRKVQIEAIRHISTTIASLSNIERILVNILEWTLALMGKASLGEIRLFEEETNELVVWASRGGSIDEKFRRISINAGITGWVARNQQAEYVPDVSEDPRYLAFLPGTKSEIAVPIMKGWKLLGVLNIEHPQVDAFTNEDVNLAGSIANLASIAIENARLYEDIKKSNDDLEVKVAQLNASYKISEAAHNARELEALYPEIHNIVGELMPAKNFYIAIMNLCDSKNPFVYFTDQYKKTIQIESGLAGYVLRTQHQFLGTPEALEKLTEQGEIKRVEKPSKSWLGVPLKTHGKTIGVMAVYSYNEDIIYGKKELDIMLFVSEQVAMAVERVQAQEELRKHQSHLQESVERLNRLNRRKEVLIQLSQTLTSEIQLDEKQICNLIYNNASELMDTDNMYIALYNSQTDFIRFGLAYKNGRRIHTDSGEEEPGYKPRPFGRGKTEAIIQSRLPIFHPTQAEAEAWYIEPGHIAYDPIILPSWVGVPMITRDKVLGVIATYHPEKEYVYTEKDVEILQAMANIAAIAMENATLYQQLEEKNQQLEEKIVDLKKAQNDIADRERDLVMSGLAMDFIHKMNNIAGTIPPWVTLIKRKLSSEIDLKVHKYLDNISRDTRNILKEANDLKSFSSKPEHTDMEEITGSVLAQVEMMASPDIEFNFESETDLFCVYGIKEHLSVAIYSIITNSVKAISGQGEIDIQLHNFTNELGRHVEISISDSGCGIPQDKQDSVFEYGTSYWEDKKGTGYGLWRARNIIQSINGNITIHNREIGEGTTFKVTLPAADVKSIKVSSF